MIRTWWERLKAWGFIGLALKIGVTLLTGAMLVSFLHFVLWDFIAPILDRIVYVVGHIGQIGTR